MGKMKRNHWVPQSYLRAFAADPDKKEKIWRFSKEEGDPELKSIAKVACRHYLYAPKDASGQRDYSFEVQLSRLEQWFGERPWELLLTEYLNLGDQTFRKMVSLLAAVMFLRNPRSLELSNNVHWQMVDILKELPELPQSFEHKGKTYAVDTSSWGQFKDGDDEALKKNWIATVKQAGWLAELLMTMRWSMVVSDTPGFITSDHPVTVVHPSLSFRGFNDPETFVIFPLSPYRLLVMDHRMNEPAGHYYPAGDALPSWNYSIWRNANEYMFCHRNPDEVLSELVADAEQRGFA
jgi:hypothetical protein